jgi:hypothetical protein
LAIQKLNASSSHRLLAPIRVNRSTRPASVIAATSSSVVRRVEGGGWCGTMTTVAVSPLATPQSSATVSTVRSFDRSLTT